MYARTKAPRDRGHSSEDRDQRCRRTLLDQARHPSIGAQHLGGLRTQRVKERDRSYRQVEASLLPRPISAGRPWTGPSVAVVSLILWKIPKRRFRLLKVIL